MNVRRHGWQRPLHPLQIVGMVVFSFLVVAFYVFLGLFLGNRVAEITVTSIFTFVVLAAIFLFVRCTAIDPTDKTSSRKKKKKRGRLGGLPKLKYGFILGQIVLRFFRRLERKILLTFIRRKYLGPWNTSMQVEPLLPFPLVLKDDAVSPDLKEDDTSFCILCNFEVKKHSKHCRTCNRCVEGFDHHCRWLNNCIGKRNYTAFILLMVSVLLMFIIEGGTAIAIFVRCFADKKGLEHELLQRLHGKFPRGVLATIAVLLFLFTSYSSAALGQLFLFHIVLIRKGMRTYDYILAMKEENQTVGLDPFDDSDSGSDSDESSDFSSPEKPSFVSRFICRGGQRLNQNATRLSIRIDGDPESTSSTKKESFHVSINPWSLLKLSKDTALAAADRARERLLRQKPANEPNPLRPLPLEKKSGPLMQAERSMNTTVVSSTPVVSKPIFPASPGRFSSPRRRFSGSPKGSKYRSNFDLKLTEVSRELETYISRQVVCSIMKKDGSEASPRSGI